MLHTGQQASQVRFSFTPEIIALSPKIDDVIITA
ncbi:predicted protein [Botrytis cinerea T4]|uniref:Uncharacterized protein n=1 Tax=Botryotinia fuckeliana (strain T4) TaxID=999810 RepID=G2YLP8_BOTF4|nr:predicted protein [Botrytis cinerea T4]